MARDLTVLSFIARRDEAQRERVPSLMCLVRIMLLVVRIAPLGLIRFPFNRQQLCFPQRETQCEW